MYDAQKLTTAQYLDKWLQATRDTVRLGTWMQYEMITRLHIKSTLGNVKLDKLHPLQLQTLYRERLDACSSCSFFCSYPSVCLPLRVKH